MYRNGEKKHGTVQPRAPLSHINIRNILIGMSRLKCKACVGVSSHMCVFMYHGKSIIRSRFDTQSSRSDKNALNSRHRTAILRLTVGVDASAHVRTHINIYERWWSSPIDRSIGSYSSQFVPLLFAALCSVYVAHTLQWFIGGYINQWQLNAYSPIAAKTSCLLTIRHVHELYGTNH